MELWQGQETSVLSPALALRWSVNLGKSLSSISCVSLICKTEA